MKPKKVKPIDFLKKVSKKTKKIVVSQYDVLSFRLKFWGEMDDILSIL